MIVKSFFISVFSLLLSLSAQASHAYTTLDVEDFNNEISFLQRSSKGMPGMPKVWSMQTSYIERLTCPVFYHWDPENHFLTVNIEQTFAYEWSTQGMKNKAHSAYAGFLKSCSRNQHARGYELEFLGLLPTVYGVTPEQIFMLILSFSQINPFTHKALGGYDLHDDWNSFWEHLRDENIESWLGVIKNTVFSEAGEDGVRKILTFNDIKKVRLMAPSYTKVEYIKPEVDSVEKLITKLLRVKSKRLSDSNKDKTIRQ